MQRTRINAIHMSNFPVSSLTMQLTNEVGHKYVSDGDNSGGCVWRVSRGDSGLRVTGELRADRFRLSSSEDKERAAEPGIGEDGFGCSIDNARLFREAEGERGLITGVQRELHEGQFLLD